MAILGAAQHTGRRRSVVSEIAAALGHRGVYTGSREELLPTRGDRRSMLPMAAAAVVTSVRPRWFRFFTDGAVSHYALSPIGWRQLCDLAPATAVSGARA